MMSDADKAEIKAMLAEASLEDRKVTRDLVKVATEEAITETFKVMGIDVNDFSHINDFRENQSWVKKYRRASETIGSRILVTITTILTGSVIAALWAYLQTRGN